MPDIGRHTKRISRGGAECIPNFFGIRFLERRIAVSESIDHAYRQRVCQVMRAFAD